MELADVELADVELEGTVAEETELPAAASAARVAEAEALPLAGSWSFSPTSMMFGLATVRRLAYQMAGQSALLP